jgi:hypothetical protein
MAKQPDSAGPAAAGRYGGFSLKSVCWGYREVFAQTIERLFSEGLIGEGRREVTGKFFELLKHADQHCFDHVLKEFLGALNPRTRWLLDLPGVFADVVDLGRELAETRLYYGVRFFDTLGSGGFGETAEQVRDLLSHVRRLRQVDDDLAVAFMKGYRRLIDRLSPEEIPLYVEAALESFARNRRAGLAFIAGELKSSEAYIVSITRECRLDDVRGVLAPVLRALAGCDVELGDLSTLDSDDLIDRGSAVVCLYRWLYLPARIREFDTAELNRKWYLLACVAAAGMLAEDSFPRVHGHPRYETCRSVAGSDPLHLNLFQVAEYARVLRRIKSRWPGARRLVDFGLRTQFHERPPAGPAERLLRDATLAEADAPPPVRRLLREADASVNFFDTAERLKGDWTAELLAAYPGLDAAGIRPLAFLPDFLFPGSVERPPRDGLVADLKQTARRRRRDEEGGEAWRAAAPGEGDRETDEEAEEAVAAAYVYDEWSQDENDYYRDYCFVHEKVPAPAAGGDLPADVAEQARRVSRVFERFKPDLLRREKYLREGDVINADLLLDYLVLRRKEPSPRVRFYERPRVNRRDLAVLILIDSSGSTGELVERREKIIDVEKHAALILGQGLAALGDRFAVCGFCSNGRENCSYFVYKDFADPWDRDAAGRVLAAFPSNSTRIGPALRHSGYRLAALEARQRLIIVVTDGRPMDAGYDPNTRYAQHDVRMACEENARQSIHTFGISTEENSLADMEIMFPQRRFAILPDIRCLPRILPRLYIRLTA